MLNSVNPREFSSSLDEGHCDNGFGDRLSSMDLGLELTYTAISDFFAGATQYFD